MSKLLLVELVYFFARIVSGQLPLKPKMINPSTQTAAIAIQVSIETRAVMPLHNTYSMAETKKAHVRVWAVLTSKSFVLLVSRNSIFSDI